MEALYLLLEMMETKLKTSLKCILQKLFWIKITLLSSRVEGAANAISDKLDRLKQKFEKSHCISCSCIENLLLLSYFLSNWQWTHQRDHHWPFIQTGILVWPISSDGCDVFYWLHTCRIHQGYSNFLWKHRFYSSIGLFQDLSFLLWWLLYFSLSPNEISWILHLL